MFLTYVQLKNVVMNKWDEQSFHASLDGEQEKTKKRRVMNGSVGSDKCIHVCLRKWQEYTTLLPGKPNSVFKYLCIRVGV